MTIFDYLERCRKLHGLRPFMPGFGEIGVPNRVEPPEKADVSGKWDD